MSDNTPTEAAAPAREPTDTTIVTEAAPRPAGWMYKRLPFNLYYASPKAQLLMVSMVCFLCPGMFNALTGLGGGGVSAKAAADANTALNSTFAVVAFFAGTFANTLGIKLTMSLGGLGYCIYAASFLSYSHNKNEGFVIFAGAFLGACAGLLWCGQGAIMMSYPTEAEKGRYIGIFWVIFNLGAVIGALIPLGQNVNNITGPVTDGTYAAFIVLMFLGAVLALFLANADDVIRPDGSKVIIMKNPSWKTEFKGLWEMVRSDPWILALFPMFFTSNIFYTYQLNEYNFFYFNTRTRTLNSLLYWTSQIIGALVFGYGLDFPKAGRSLRAKGSFVALAVTTFAIWGGGWAYQSKQPSRAVLADEGYVRVDWTDGGEAYIGPMFLFMFYGFFDAAWQTCIYWYMGALTNSGRKAANLAGFYKGIQSAGAAIFWALDSRGVALNAIFGATWGILALGLIVAAPIIWLRIKDVTPIEQDLKYSDETIEDVKPVTTVPAGPNEKELVV